MSSIRRSKASIIIVTDRDEAIELHKTLGGWLLDMKNSLFRKTYIITDDAGLLVQFRSKEYLEKIGKSKTWSELK